MADITDLRKLKESMLKNAKAAGEFHKLKMQKAEQKRLADIADQATTSPSSSTNGVTTPK